MDGPQARELLQRARLMLLFTPELCGGRPPLEVLEAALPEVDLVQVRVKPPGRPGAPSPGREVYEWTAAVLALVAERPGLDVPVLVNDRVDVAGALAGRGCAGVHVGDGDLPASEARALLGGEAVIGLSTHGPRDVAAAAELPVDYLGFGPVHATATKGYGRGLGAEAAWVAQAGTGLPLFPIGGIAPENAAELAPVGRAAVSAAVLGAPDPAAAARALRGLLAASDRAD